MKRIVFERTNKISVKSLTDEHMIIISENGIPKEYLHNDGICYVGYDTEATHLPPMHYDSIRKRIEELNTDEGYSMHAFIHGKAYEVDKDAEETIHADDVKRDDIVIINIDSLRKVMASVLGTNSMWTAVSSTDTVTLFDDIKAMSDYYEGLYACRIKLYVK
jgi:hypothetical protein